MSTLPRAQKPKIPLLRVPLEGADHSLSDSEVSKRTAPLCPSLSVCEDGRERGREGEKGGGPLGVLCQRMFCLLLGGRIPVWRHLKPQQWIIVWRSLADYCRLAKLYCKQVAFQGAPAHISISGVKAAKLKVGRQYYTWRQ